MVKDKLVTLQAVAKHGEDDFSVWECEWFISDLQPHAEQGDTFIGSLEELFDLIPPGESETTAHFIFKLPYGDQRGEYKMWSVNLGENTFEEYQTEGWSIRSDQKEIMQSVEAQEHSELIDKVLLPLLSNTGN